MTLDDAATNDALQAALAEAPFTTPTARDALQALLWRWFSESGALHAEHPALFWLTIGGLVVMLLLLLWHIVFSLRTTWQAVRASGTSLLFRPAAAPLDFSGAHEAMADADYRRVIERAFALAQRALMGEAGTMTPRAFFSRFRGELGAQERRQLERLVTLHEAACYAEAEVTEGAAREALDAARALAARA